MKSAGIYPMRFGMRSSPKKQRSIATTRRPSWSSFSTMPVVAARPSSQITMTVPFGFGGTNSVAESSTAADSEPKIGEGISIGLLRPDRHGRDVERPARAICRNCARWLACQSEISFCDVGKLESRGSRTIRPCARLLKSALFFGRATFNLSAVFTSWSLGISVARRQVDRRRKSP